MAKWGWSTVQTKIDSSTIPKVTYQAAGRVKKDIFLDSLTILQPQFGTIVDVLKN
jgi:hypothetical protein